jgi:hypothetical protein
MKKSLVLLFAIFISYYEINAQINLEHTFDGTPSAFFYTPSQMMYVFRTDNNISFYNENYTFYKAVNIPTPSGYSIYQIFGYSTILFNSDNLVEFYVTFNKDDYTDNIGKIFNDNGVIIKTFSSSIIGSYWKTMNNGYRLNVYRYITIPDNYVTEVYSLPGTIVSLNESAESNILINPFPNPAVNEIFLPYKLDGTETADMLIFNSDGKLIDKFRIGDRFDKISLNTSSYLPGIYIYKYENKSNKFIVK